MYGSCDAWHRQIDRTPFAVEPRAVHDIPRCLIVWPPFSPVEPVGHFLCLPVAAVVVGPVIQYRISTYHNSY